MSYQPNQPNMPPPGQRPPNGQPQYPQPGQPPQYQQPGYGQPQQPPPGYGQQPGYGQPPQQPLPGYAGYQPMNYTAAPAAVRGRNPIYAGAALGGILLIVCAFLPWFSINITGGGTTTVTGLGGVSGDLKDLYGGSAGVKDGIFALILGGIILLFSVLGLFTNRRAGAIGALVAGVFATLLMFYELADINKSSGDLTAIGASFTTGIGIYIGIAGALLGLVGSIVALVVKRR